ncbi:MAG: SDR family oxidoreductase [Acidobacteriota bacterium]|jgi:NAD(P)-dependent dehydrogenase (short-subunit alcohol dehydrogenase family)|nr:MAG: short-chain dehydrogenase [Acidobacteriota bacterium]
MDPASRVVVITGGRRMGEAVGVRLAARGAHVVFTHRGSPEAAEAAAAAVAAAGSRADVLPLDVTDGASVERLVADVDARFGRLDVLINMASIYESVPFDSLTEEQWHRQLQVDLHGTFRMCLAAVGLMRRSGGGRIINFTDWVAASSRPRYYGYTAYYVAKAGVKALTEALALELAPDGILVNAIAPGPILPPAGTDDEEADAVAKATPIGRWGGPGEIAKVVEALVESDFISGETIRVDGGRHVR